MQFNVWKNGGHGRNRTGVHGFAVRCVTTPPRGQSGRKKASGAQALYRTQSITTISTRTLRFGPSLPQKEPPSAPLIEDRDDRFCRCTPQYGGRSGPTADVTDPRILSAMLEIPRENFVPPASAALAYLDLTCPSGRQGPAPPQADGPRQADPRADIKSSDRVFDVGCGTGYAAAVLARMAGQVAALDEDSGLVQAARTASRARRMDSVERSAGRRLAERGAVRCRLFEGATEFLPEAFLSQLQDGGRLACILGGGPGAKAMLYFEAAGAWWPPGFRCQRADIARFCQNPDVCLLYWPKRCGNMPVRLHFVAKRPQRGFNPG